MAGILRFEARVIGVLPDVLVLQLWKWCRNYRIFRCWIDGGVLKGLRAVHHSAYWFERHGFPLGIPRVTGLPFYLKVNYTSRGHE